MEPTQHALAILKRARDMLLDRLADRVVDAKNEIVEDALGLSYTSEIDDIHEQLGTRLSHLNNLISHMQVAEKDRPKFADDDESVIVRTDAADRAGAPYVQADTSANLTSEARLLLAPPGNLPVPNEEVTFADFADQIRAADLDAAGRSLAQLFAIEPAVARRSAQVFADRLAHSPEVINQAMQLRIELQRGSVNAALMLLHECFGLQGVDSLRVIEALRARLAG